MIHRGYVSKRQTEGESAKPARGQITPRDDVGPEPRWRPSSRPARSVVVCYERPIRCDLLCTGDGARSCVFAAMWLRGGGVVTRSPGGKNLVTAGHQRRVRERESSSSVRSFRSSTALGSFYLDQFLLFLLQSVPISPAAVSYSLPVALSVPLVVKTSVDTGVLGNTG